MDKIKELLKALAAAAGETISPKQIQAIEEAVEGYVATEKEDSRNAARQSLFKQFKSQLGEAFPDVVTDEDIESRGTKWEELVKKASAAAKKAPSEPGKDKQAPQETEAELRARLKSEHETILAKEKRKLRSDAFLQKIVATATAQGLDPDYEDSFVDKFSKMFALDTENENHVTVLKGETPWFIGGSAAKPEDVVKEIFGKYSKLKKSSVSTPDPNNFEPDQGGQGGQVAGDIDLEGAILKEMPAAGSFFRKGA